MKALFISYDGMTDPLGGSQVIPYLRGLSAKGHQISILSCEKPERFGASRQRIQALLESSGIGWHPLTYHKKPPMLSTLWDLQAMSRKAMTLVRDQGIGLVHCRSYVPSLVGLRIKRRLGTRFIFDMRGFWADERVDGGLWNLSRPHYRQAYRYFKKQERHFLEDSDRTVSLTHAGKSEMLRWRLSSAAEQRIDVIPCCADVEHFDPKKVSAEAKAKLRAELGLEPGDFVVSYLGSLGTWYLLDEMLGFFKALLAKRPEAKFLFITPDDPGMVRQAAARMGIGADKLRVREGARAEVPALLSISRLGLFFIRPSYSKISSSPTKMAEILAMGIPIVTNANVGDTDWLARKYGVAEVVEGFGPDQLARAVEKLSELERIPEARIRDAACDYFALERGVEAYHKIYSELSSKSSGDGR